MATFGKTVLGDSWWLIDSENQYVRGCLYPLQEAGWVSAVVTFLYWGATGNVGRCLIYDADGKLVAITEEMNSGAEGDWVTFNLPTPVLLLAGNYYLCFEGPAYLSVSAGAPQQTRYTLQEYGDTADPIVWENSLDNEVSIYAIYDTTGTPPQITLSPQSATLLSGETQEFTSTVTGGQPPYTIDWYDSLTGNLLGSGESYLFTAFESGNYGIYAIVVDAEGLTGQSDVVPITVVNKRILSVNSIPITGIPVTIRKVS